MRIRSTKPEFCSGGLLPGDPREWRNLGSRGPGGEFVYRFYDEGMRLLYVGITWSPFARWNHHRKTKPWWGDVRRYDLHRCPSEREARDWESWFIKELDPLHNKHQNRRWHRGENTDNKA